MPDLPDKNFQPNDIDEVIRHYGKPIGAERKTALMAKLEAEREPFVQKQKEAQSQEQQRDQGRER